MKKTTIDTSLLPKVYLHWETTKGTFYLDCAEGKKYTASEFHDTHDLSDRSSYIYASSGSKVRYAEAFEICEYGAQMDENLKQQLFPF